MRNAASLSFIVVVLFLCLNGCGPGSYPAISTTAFPPTVASPTPTLRPIPQGETIIVTSAEDSGSGTLREALQMAGPGDFLAFDLSIFSSDDPKTIYLKSTLPAIEQGNVTVDASKAGVILDGSNIPPGWDSAIQVLSNNNIVRGLTLMNFSGAAIQISGGQDNLIEGNVIGHCDWGIGVWGTNATGNQIAANYLGVMLDGVTSQGNTSGGIIVMEGAHNNLIGPDNQIAYNGQNGVEIFQEGSVENTIFKNSIHDNGMGVALQTGGNKNITPPILMDFNLETGKVNGMACPNCDVLFYSDMGDEGAIFEGQTVADGEGLFSFEKGSAFGGPGLTATATDPQGDTSGFSIPTTGSRLTMQLQFGNNLPRTIMVTKPSDDLEDNRLGSLWSDLWQPMNFQAVIDNEIVPAGLKWGKITMNQAEYYSNEQSGVVREWDKPELFISPEFDDYISQLVSHKITIFYMLNFWDKANHPNGWDIQYRFKTEEDISHYLEYIRFIVTQFKGRVQYYELWNEPDAGFPLQYIEPADYINLAKQAIPLIKQIDPQAKVVVGCTSGSANPQARDYLFKILNSDLMPIADAVSWHPLYGNVPNSGSNPEYYASYPSLLDSIIETAKQNGFKGEFIAGEISYGGPECGGCDVGSSSYTEVVWAKYTARGIILHFGNDVAVSVGGLSSQRIVHYNTIRNIANVFSGVHADAFDVKVQADGNNFKAFTFAGTDGSKLFTLWTDGIAGNDDSGISSKITFPGLSGWNATGVDILNGFEQKLISNSENGDLVIRDLLIKDYPIIIRLSN